MLSAIAIVPSAPVMVPDLAGAATAELDELRKAVTAAAAALPRRWLAVGIGPADEVVGSDCVGTFAGYGVDVRVRLSPPGAAAPPVLGDTPLCALIAGWLRGRVDPQARVEVRVCAPHHDAKTATECGRRLRAEIDALAEPVGILVVADGAATLSPTAPGGYDPDSVPVQRLLDDALASGDTAALGRLPRSVVGRTAYQVLAGLVGPGGPRSAKELYRGVPYGVGYFAGVWQP